MATNFDENISSMFERKAREGAGPYAIAYALMELMNAQVRTAQSIDNLAQVMLQKK